MLPPTATKAGDSLQMGMQDKIDSLVSAGFLPEGFDLENPRPDYNYIGDLMNSEYRKIARIAGLTLPEIEEFIENKFKKSGRYYLYPKDKNSATSIKIPFDILCEEESEPVSKQSNIEELITLRIENKHLSQQVIDQRSELERLRTENSELRGKQSEMSLLDQWVKLRAMETTEFAKGRGEAAGIQTVLDSFKQGREMGSEASTELISVYRSTIDRLEAEKRELIENHQAEISDLEQQIDDLEEQIDEYKRKVGELPQENSLVKEGIELVKGMMESKDHPALPPIQSHQQEVQAMNQEDQLFLVISRLLRKEITTADAAGIIIPEIPKLNFIYKTAFKSMTPEGLADIILEQTIERRMFGESTPNASQKANILKRLTELAKAVKQGTAA